MKKSTKVIIALVIAFGVLVTLNVATTTVTNTGDGDNQVTVIKGWLGTTTIYHNGYEVFQVIEE